MLVERSMAEQRYDAVKEVDELVQWGDAFDPSGTRALPRISPSIHNAAVVVVFRPVDLYEDHQRSSRCDGYGISLEEVVAP